MRSFQEIAKELGEAMNLIIDKKNNLASVTKKADEMIKEANTMKSEANSELSTAQDKAYELRKEYDSLMSELLPAVDSGRVRQSK